VSVDGCDGEKYLQNGQSAWLSPRPGSADAPSYMIGIMSAVTTSRDTSTTLELHGEGT
jgi:hypothetical protein